MASCDANCSACSGCGRTLELTQPEIDFLKSLGQVPFQPIVRQMGDEFPTYPGGSEELNLVLRILEKKNLISLDYDRPLSGYTEHGYLSYPIRGSVALTARGQQILDWMEYQGISL